MLNAQHGVHWIHSQMPGNGNLIIYNNNPTDTTGQDNTVGNSSVVEITPPINSGGNNGNFKNTALCLSAYNKKQEFWGGKIIVDGINCPLDKIFQEKNSIIEVSM